jgi:hypothetical protein
MLDAYTPDDIEVSIKVTNEFGYREKEGAQLNQQIN